MPTITIIVAMSDNHVIGNKNEIPWHIKEDLIRFRSITTGKTIIVGRKTFEMIRNAYQKRGKPMPDRNTIIVTNNPDYQTDVINCYITNSVEAAITLGKQIEKSEIFIAGGASIYKQALSFANKLDLTVVHTNIDGDAFFPEYKNIFAKVISNRESRDENYNYTFFELAK